MQEEDQLSLSDADLPLFYFTVSMLVRRALLALSLLALLPSLTAQIVLSRFDLTEEGQPDSTSVAVEIPSMVQRDLLHQGLIPHPFVGTSEDSIQWVSDREWVYRTTFELSGAELSGCHSQ